jgi:hypothetical protein
MVHDEEKFETIKMVNISIAITCNGVTRFILAAVCSIFMELVALSLHFHVRKGHN